MERIDNAGLTQSLGELDFERIASSLAGLAQHERVTKKAIVRQHLTAIEAALSRRVGYEMVARTLTEAGCAISASVLRRYVCELRARLANAGDRQAKEEGGADRLVMAPEHVVAPSEHPVLTPDDAAQASLGSRRSLRRTAWINSTNEVEDGHHG